mmetsp:Transcript_11838/g.13466  ORF Transcript_11838/g.13466 Transcript_11838/m.13466 type:complete len:236 (-) Transcript_11838:232-939(-)
MTHQEGNLLFPVTKDGKLIGAKDEKYFDVMAFHLENIPRNENNEITTEGLINCLEGRVAAIYPILFGGKGVLSKQLGADLDGNVAKIKRHYLSHSQEYGTIDQMVQAEVSREGVKKLLKHKDVAVKGVLWLTRTLNFLCTFCEKIIERGGDARKVAKETYAETLKPYHGWIGTTTFGSALSFVSDERKLMKTFGYAAWEEFEASAIRFAQLIRPIIDENFAVLIKHDVHFTYKVM